MSEGHEFLYEFGPYVLHERERVLTRDGEVVSIAPKALDTLLVLLRHSGRLVIKEELMSEVWPSTYVEEANLTQNISILRKVLDDGDDESYIETLPRRGYRFLRAVRKTSAESAAQERGAERNYRFLAILPFVNDSGNPEMDYLSDGITESIINSLSQLPQLRVMSRNAVFRYKGKSVDARWLGRELRVDAVLLGRVNLLGERLTISTELVDVGSGWQLWGKNYDGEARAILEVQEEIAKEISSTLRLRLTGDEEQRLTKRYTESSDAYQAYLQGRYYWSNFTRDGLEQATVYFRQAIKLDPNYALPYAGIVDCYLRLATNYIPPADVQSSGLTIRTTSSKGALDDVESETSSVKTRYQWDFTGVERESKRATELKTSYPAAHQWLVAYRFSMSLKATLSGDDPSQLTHREKCKDDPELAPNLPVRSDSSTTTLNEQVQVFCTVVREQLEVGNYEAAYAALQLWWTIGEWPRVEGLTPHTAADLLFTVGMLAGCLTSSRQIQVGQKHAEALLSGAIGIFEHLGSRARSAEGQIELACCYYRQGLFDLARSILTAVLGSLSGNDQELRALSLIRLAVIERHAGRPRDALTRLNEASEIVEPAGPWATGRYHQELGSTLKDLALAERNNEYFDEALVHYERAAREFAAVGNHRYAAVVENNLGFMLLTLGDFDNANKHLLVAKRLFKVLCDKVRSAQVHETLARLHLATEDLRLAEDAINRAVEILEAGDEEALLAEALATRGLVLSKLGRKNEASRALEASYRVAERCGYNDGAGRALVILWEQLNEELEHVEMVELGDRIARLLKKSEQTSKDQELLEIQSLIRNNPRRD